MKECCKAWVQFTHDICDSKNQDLEVALQREQRIVEKLETIVDLQTGKIRELQGMVKILDEENEQLTQELVTSEAKIDLLDQLQRNRDDEGGEEMPKLN
jgi:hypothetical protein